MFFLFFPAGGLPAIEKVLFAGPSITASPDVGHFQQLLLVFLVTPGDLGGPLSCQHVISAIAVIVLAPHV